MSYKRCTKCIGYGKILGGGMMQVDCDLCFGSGKIHVKDIDEEDYDDDEYSDIERKINEPIKRKGRPKRIFEEDL